MTGLWRPSPPGTPPPAADAIRPVINKLLASSHEDVRLLAASAAGDYKIAEAAPALFDLAFDFDAKGKTRAAALHSLAALGDPRLGEALTRASSDSNVAVREEATRLRAEFKPSNAIAELSSVIAKGDIAEQQNAFLTLGGLKDPKADALIGAYLDALIQGRIRAEVRLDLLEAAEKRSNPGLNQKIKQYEASKSNSDGLAPYREALFGGDPAEGRKVFFEKPEASCVRCHKIGKEGGEVGPNLSDIGKRQTREYILESVVFPNKQIAPGFETWMVTLKNGTSYAGTVKAENDTDLILNTAEDGVVKMKKLDIVKRDAACPYARGHGRRSRPPQSTELGGIPRRANPKITAPPPPGRRSRRGIM